MKYYIFSFLLYNAYINTNNFGGKNNMKNRFSRKMVRLCLTLILAIISLSGCSSSSGVTDSGFINTDVYENTDYWKEDSINVITNLKTVTENLEDENAENQQFSKLSAKQEKKVEKLKKCICNYFIEKYGIDFSTKLKKQEVSFFSTRALGNGVVMGYVDVDNPNELHLNILLNKDCKDKFENTYVHETLHQLGFMDKSGKMTYVVEGIVDAYTDLILIENNIKSKVTGIYFETRQLGYQIIAADKNLPKLFVEKKAVSEYFDNELSSYKQNYAKHNKLAEYLNTLLQALIAINSGTTSSSSQSNAYFYAFDAQSIVQRFCQSQNCDNDTIDYIRKHYLLEDFEKLNVIDNGNDSYSIN